MMRLSDFILNNREVILQEWEDFATSLRSVARQLDKVELRDHVKKILEAIASDLAQPQTEQEETKKSKGHDDTPADKKTAAATHGKERLALGFSLDDAVAEYRALRASVTRLWQKSLLNEPIADTVIGDLIRFNEAVDQAINESVTSYTFEKEQSMRVFDTILSSSPDLSFTFDLDGRFTYINRALSELFELAPTKMIGKSFHDLDLPNAVELQDQLDQVISTQKFFRGEMPYTSPSGQRSVYEYIFVPVLDTNGAVEAIAGTARNVTERKAIEDLNWQKANHDSLTGLPNRHLFFDRLERAVRHAARIGARIALLFIDLDHFKETNDSFGHTAGDLLLRMVTDRLSACVRETDTVARLGGDEFTVILQNLADTQHAEIVAGKILETLATPFQIFNDTVHISASIGIAFSPQDAAAADQLLKNADQAMYRAKNAGRNQLRLFVREQR